MRWRKSQGPNPKGGTLEEIEKEKARQRQGTRTDLSPNLPQNFAEGKSDERLSRRQIGRAVGLGSGE